MGKGINTNITFIRIDPATQAIARMRKQFGASNERVIRDIRKIVRGDEIDLRQLLVIDEVRRSTKGFDPITRQEVTKDEGGTPLLVAAGGGKGDDCPGWRLLGCEDTMGIGILFGQGVGGGMVDCPVDIEWVRKRIRWVPGETDAQIAERAAAWIEVTGMIPSSATGQALTTAVDQGPFQPGDSVYWIADDYRDKAASMLENSLTDEQSGGRRLTRFGAAVRDVLLAQEAARG